MNSAESTLLAQVRAGQEQANARLEALLAAIHRLCDLVARMAPVQEDLPGSAGPPAAAAVDHPSMGDAFTTAISTEPA